MERRKPLVSRKGLARSQGLRRGGRIRQVSVKRQGEAEQRRTVREQALARAGHRCEAELVVPEVECGGPLDVDERASRGAHPGSHLRVELCQVLCRRHHDWRHEHPAEARARGLRWTEADLRERGLL